MRHPVLIVVLLLIALNTSIAQEGPWENDILLRLSADGTVFKPPVTLVKRAGVSTLTIDSSNILIAAFQWFPEHDEESFDKIAVMVSSDRGQSWTPPTRAQFINLPPNITRQFDPTLVTLPDGRIRMYFTGNPDSSRVLNNNTGIYSAVSTDNIHFTYEEGERFGMEDAPVIDCAAVLHQGTFHLFSPVQGEDGSAYHATSTDGLNFTRQDDIVASSNQNWLGCALSTPEGIRFYGTGTHEPLMSVWSALSADGSAWDTAQSLGFGGADPGVAIFSDGTTVISITGKLASPGSSVPPEIWTKIK